MMMKHGNTQILDPIPQTKQIPLCPSCISLSPASLLYHQYSFSLSISRVPPSKCRLVSLGNESNAQLRSNIKLPNNNLYSEPTSHEFSWPVPTLFLLWICSGGHSCHQPSCFSTHSMLYYLSSFISIFVSTTLMTLL